MKGPTVTPTAFPGRWLSLLVEHGGLNIHDSWWVIPSLKRLLNDNMLECYDSELGPAWTYIELKGQEDG